VLTTRRSPGSPASSNRPCRPPARPAWSTTLNDGVAWGLFPILYARHGLTVSQIGVLAALYPAVVGDLELAFESFTLAADPSQSLLTYTAEPGSPSQDALSLLASWAASTAHDSPGRTRRPACCCEKPAQGAAAPKTRTPGSAAVVEGHLVAVGVRERESAAERPVDGR
jgi:MmyB-like transcription regulator ligand binding domain